MVGQEPVVGVLMLDTRFPRIAGDIGNPASIPYRSIYRHVPRASVSRVVVSEALPEDLLLAFEAAGRLLVDEGATLIVTSCGFLHAAQARLSRTLCVPVATSSLVLLPELHARHGQEGAIGVLTFDARALGERHLGAAAREIPVVVQGMEHSRIFYPTIAEDLPDMDSAAMEHDARRAAEALARASPGAVLLECTNLSPYRCAIQEALGGLPVYDLHDVIAMLAAEPFAQPDG